ncbi:MAG: DNA polymerase/3'-5' exonuclease PolX [Verrucomicrobia bacterium]|nr:MAG: DNA polymerase/3'-5' exonuclease PolX [Verrucomicrobiota bacterium]PYL95649.1 MAG: DNA polymerase/3'-5' exonuclease PolX [Verrucomicrobiota bacterium]
MTKSQIADVLQEIATLLELNDENPFKIRAYANAARSLETFGGNLADLQDEEALAKIPGIGKAIAAKVKELAATGSLKYLEELRSEFPAAILDLFSISGLGAKKIKALYEQLHISSIEQLREACESGRVAQLPGFGETTQAKICTAIEQRAKHSGYFQFGQIAAEAESLRRDLATRPDVLQVDVAGSYRRRREIVRDVDLVVATKKPAAITEFFVKHALVESIIAQGPTKTSVRLRSGIQCDLRVVSSAEYPFALNYFTGSKEHNIEMRSRALQRGWTLNEYRLARLPPDPKAKKVRAGRAVRKSTIKIPTVREEADLYRALGLDFVPPELRENCGEFEAAENHSLPRLLERENLRGTFHCHTIASDGHNTLEEMAAAAQELGLEYLGIAEHSKSSIQAHGIDAAKLRSQIGAIRKLNKTFDGFRVFAGVECDILRDGKLDFEDEILAELDFAVASIHSVFNLSEAEMTKRIIRAMENPFITILGHPTGRLLLKRDPYLVDVPAVLEAAAATGTWIELNSATKRLDLDWRWWPLAKQKGVKCVINPDAHRTERLQDLWFGVGIARKGWLTKSDVMNCLPLGKIESELQAKRSKKA